MTPTITPCLWFDDNLEEAAEFAAVDAHEAVLVEHERGEQRLTRFTRPRLAAAKSSLKSRSS